MQIEKRIASDRSRGKRDGIRGSETPVRVTIHALTCLIAASGVLIAARASANPVTLIQDERFVTAVDCSQFGCPGPEARPPSGFAPWIVGVSAAGQSAIQNSSMSQATTESRMQGSLATGPNVQNPHPDSQSLSIFAVTFDATQNASYTLSGDASVTVDSPEFPLSITAVELQDVTANQWLYNNYDPGPISHSGFLTAGHRYRINLVTQGGYKDSASVNFEFVPEPGRRGMLASGVALVAALAAARQRPKASALRG